jgi:hypothetical protein
MPDARPGFFCMAPISKARVCSAGIQLPKRTYEPLDGIKIEMQIHHYKLVQ